MVKRKKLRSVGDASSTWDSLPWQSVDVSSVDVLGGCDGGMFYGLEEVDGNDYLLTKDSTTNAYQVSVQDKHNSKRQKLLSSNPDSNLFVTPNFDSTEMLSESDNDDNTVGEDIVEKKLTKKEKAREKAKQKAKERKEKAKSDSILEVDEDETVPHHSPVKSKWGDIFLHKVLVDSLLSLGFDSPTPIQTASVPLVCKGTSDVVGAAETGSGKTLAFCLPMLNTLITDWNEIETNFKNKVSCCPFATIIVPTRELALQINGVLKQVCASFRKIYRIEIASIVGGMSEQKQRRQLDGRPLHVLVATPGRLCELMQDETIPVFKNMSKIRFLIVDEADRIVEDGHFPELNKIFDRIRDHEQTKDSNSFENNSTLNDKDDSDINAYDDDYDVDAIALKEIENLDFSIPGFAKMPTEEELEEARRTTPAIPFHEIDDSHFSMSTQKNPKKKSIQNERENSAIDAVYLRQTLLFSATALRSQSVHSQVSKRKKITKTLKGLSKEMSDQLPVHMRDLLGMIAVRQSIDIIDITSPNALNTTNISKTLASSKDRIEINDQTKTSAPLVSLPKTLTHSQINVPTDEKDLFAYYFFVKNVSHRTLLFVNSIRSARRIDGFLRALGINSRAIHSQLQQRQRLRALDAFQASPVGVLVATDVAARGLDLTKITSVLHYDIARSTEVYVHRSGRTARANQFGLSLSLVSPDDCLHHDNICTAVNLHPAMPAYDIDSELLESLRERTVLAKKVFTLSFVNSQSVKDKTWIQQNAEATDLPCDDYTIEEVQHSSKTDNKKKNELLIAQQKLKAILDTTSIVPKSFSKGKKTNKQNLKNASKSSSTLKTKGRFIVFNPADM